jgi:hypothetical protein
MALSKRGPDGAIKGGGKLATGLDGDTGRVGGGDLKGLVSALSDFSLASKLERTGVDPVISQEFITS